MKSVLSSILIAVGRANHYENDAKTEKHWL